MEHGGEDMKDVLDLLTSGRGALTESHGYMAPQQSSSFDSAEMERLMLAGRREEAMQLAVARGEWASALLVAKSLGDTHWNKVISDYASSKFIANIYHACRREIIVRFRCQGVYAFLKTKWVHNGAAHTPPMVPASPTLRRNGEGCEPDATGERSLFSPLVVLWSGSSLPP